ncbi:MAG: nucleotidyltransferase domain-containing protein [Spirochaetia bacterium]|nr:nucleotidyltransferase domain-containing protein [Spirochaetia bacterium]
MLYGSAGRGEDDESSDIDLFILTHDPDETQRLIAGAGINRKVQAVIKTPVEYSAFKEKEKVYSAEADRGITVWESRT